MHSRLNQPHRIKDGESQNENKYYKQANLRKVNEKQTEIGRKIRGKRERERERVKEKRGKQQEEGLQKLKTIKFCR